MDGMTDSAKKKLFWACFIALCATSFAFILRILVLEDLALEFNLSETQRGQIFGVGIWPFGVSIILFSLVIDKIGYGKAILFGFLAHVAFALTTIFATGYWSLYVGSLLGGLAAGAVEAAINPIVATMFKDHKTKWLNILHAGWPGGAAAAGLMVIAMPDGTSWKWKMALIFIPVVLYGLMLATSRFPASERVAAGSSHRSMLQQAGWLGALVSATLICLELGNVFTWSTLTTWSLIAVLVIGFGIYTRAAGSILFFILILTMIPLAITELGTDSWITDLMTPEMTALGLPGVSVLIYTMLVMMVLRFAAGPIVHRLQPLGLLAVCSALAIAGLLLLSFSTGMMVLIAATVYGIGKTFFWPTMLGVVSEQCPKGGALTLNMIAGIGMLAAGVIGNPLFGNIQDHAMDERLLERAPELHARVVGPQQSSVFGDYRALDKTALAALPPADAAEVAIVKHEAQRKVLRTAAIFPAAMLVVYLGLMAWFRARGGYKPVVLAGGA